MGLSYKPPETEGYRGTEGGDEGRCAELKEVDLGGSQVDCRLTLGHGKF